MKKLAIIGAGDLGQLIAHHAKQCGYTVVGFYDDFKEKGTVVDDVKLLGKLDEIQYGYQRGYFTCLMIAIGYKHMLFRMELFETLYPKIEFANIIHPSAYVDESCVLGQGIFILPSCSLDRNVQLGNNVLLNIGCTIAQDTNIGNHSFLSPSVSVAGFTKIGNCCTLGIGSTIIDNITIGDFIQTGAGAVVTKNLADAGLYLGVPAVLKQR